MPEEELGGEKLWELFELMDEVEEVEDYEELIIHIAGVNLRLKDIGAKVGPSLLSWKGLPGWDKLMKKLKSWIEKVREKLSGFAKEMGADSYNLAASFPLGSRVPWSGKYKTKVMLKSKKSGGKPAISFPNLRKVR